MNEWQDAERRAERAQELCEAQRWAEALCEIEAAVAINPNNASWHAQRGYLLEELDRDSDAVAAYTEALHLDPADPEINLAQAHALARLGRFASAIKRLRRLAKRHPRFEPAYCHRIGMYAELNRHEKAEEMFYLAQQLDADCPHCFFQIGVSLADRRLWDKALYCWNRVLELDPSYEGVHRRIAQAHRAHGRTNEAESSLLREHRDDPGNTEVLFELADLALSSGRIDDAVMKLRQVVELEPEKLPALFLLGKVLLRQGHPGEATTCFESIWNHCGSYETVPELALRWGEALFLLHRFSEAVRRLTDAVVLRPDDPIARAMLADGQLAVGAFSEAIGNYRKSMESRPDNGVAQGNLSLCLMKVGDMNGALAHAKLACKLRRNDGAPLFLAALAYIRLGQWRSARDSLSAVLRMEPANKVAQELKSRLWRLRIRRWFGGDAGRRR